MKGKTLNTTVSKIKHTPGNWEIREFSIWAFGDNHFPIKICDLPKDGMEFYEDEANARLIASAPDMLEALKICENFVWAFHSDQDALSTHSNNGVLSIVKAAIAKATNNQ